MTASRASPRCLLLSDNAIWAEVAQWPQTRYWCRRQREVQLRQRSDGAAEHWNRSEV